MTGKQAEAELIRVLDAKVAAGAKLLVGGYHDGIKCGCALQIFGGGKDWIAPARTALQWDIWQISAFTNGFDGRKYESKLDPDFYALGDRIARRYGVR